LSRPKSGWPLKLTGAIYRLARFPLSLVLLE
jgi:hypothetical protein